MVTGVYFTPSTCKFIRRVFFVIILGGLALTSTRAEVVFVSGVNAGSGWYDTNKVWDGTDYNLCWAAASSNVLQWWQDRQTYVPSNIPNGVSVGYTYESDIFRTIYGNFPNIYGNCQVINWWLVGNRTFYNPSPSSSTGWSGGYWTNYLNDSQTSLAQWYEISNSTTFSNRVVSALQHDFAITLWLQYSPNTNVAHYVTLWGYEMTSNYIDSIWISDSDDMYSGLVKYNIDPFTLSLNLDPSMYGTESLNAIQNFKIGGLYTVEGLLVAIPEPETGMLILCGIAILFIIGRLRGKLASDKVSHL
ncbi:MAG: IdeS/Mac family cysteine endopeptidase [Verrucomicrobiales bacterium]|jgi:hypothetical protein|nr:IdeS/Mac family cysteine endopeptidase [Verrucomicrobiales bacterium]